MQDHESTGSRVQEYYDDAAACKASVESGQAKNDVNCYGAQELSDEHEGLCIGIAELNYTELECTHVPVAEPKAEFTSTNDNGDKLTRKRMLNKKSSQKYREKQKVKEIELVASLRRFHLVTRLAQKFI